MIGISARKKVGGIPIPLKNMSSPVGMMIFPIYGKNVPNHQPDGIWGYNLGVQRKSCT
jgi:hypothetical protein